MKVKFSVILLWILSHIFLGFLQADLIRIFPPSLFFSIVMFGIMHYCIISLFMSRIFK
jgi:hypothetical protein